MTIYDIVADCRALERLIESEKTDPETGEVREFTDEEKADFLTWLNENQGNLDEKFTRIFKVVKNLTGQAEAAEAERDIVKAEVERLGRRAKSRRAEAERAKSLMGYALTALGMKKYKTALFSVGFQDTRKTAKAVAGFFNADTIPVEFLKRELSPGAVDDAVKSGFLYEKEGELNRGKLFYKEAGVEKQLAGVSYLRGVALVLR